MRTLTTNDIAQQIKDLVQEYGIHPFDINSGYCEEFADTICERVEDSIQEARLEWGDEAEFLFGPKHDPGSHCYIVHENKYYDAEEPYGVDSPAKLPLYCRQQNSVKD